MHLDLWTISERTVKKRADPLRARTPLPVLPHKTTPLQATHFPHIPSSRGKQNETGWWSQDRLSATGTPRTSLLFQLERYTLLLSGNECEIIAKTKKKKKKKKYMDQRDRNLSRTDFGFCTWFYVYKRYRWFHGWAQSSIMAEAVPTGVFGLHV